MEVIREEKLNTAANLRTILEEDQSFKDLSEEEQNKTFK